MKFNCFEIHAINFNDERKHINEILEMLPDGCRLPSRAELFEILDSGDVIKDICDIIKDAYFFVTDGGDNVFVTSFNYNNEDLRVDFARKRPIAESIVSCDSVIFLKYDVDLDYLCNDRRIDNYCIKRIADLMKRHNSTSLDFRVYKETYGIEVPDNEIQEDEYDTKTIEDITLEENVDGINIYIETSNCADVYLSDLHTGSIIEFLHCVENIFSKIDAGEIPLLER